MQVSDLVGHPGASRTEELAGEIDLELDMAKLEGPVDVTVRLDATSHDIIAAGTARYRTELTCHRCLTTMNREGATRFSQVYRYDGPLDDDDLEPVDGHGFIDLLPAVRDEIGLSLPLTPLCQEGCAGLCPTCGNDLNTDPCEGHEEVSSSPFAALEHLLDPQE